MLTVSPVAAVYPTIPVPQGILISSKSRMSSIFDSAFTSNTFETRYRGPSLSPLTKNREHRSAFKSTLTFCNILWHKVVRSKSLEISFTSSINKSASSNCCSSSRDFRYRWGDLALTFVVSDGERKLTWPSTTLTRGLRIPLPSNSEAEIFLTGVEAPECGGVPLGVLMCDLERSQESIKFRFAFREK